MRREGIERREAGRIEPRQPRFFRQGEEVFGRLRGQPPTVGPRIGENAPFIKGLDPPGPFDNAHASISSEIEEGVAEGKGSRTGTEFDPRGRNREKRVECPDPGRPFVLLPRQEGNRRQKGGPLFGRISDDDPPERERGLGDDGQECRKDTTDRNPLRSRKRSPDPAIEDPADRPGHTLPDGSPFFEGGGQGGGRESLKADPGDR